MATHSGILSWKILWKEESGGLKSMEFFRQEYWTRLPFPTPGDLPDPGIEPISLASLALAATWERQYILKIIFLLISPSLLTLQLQ